MKYYFAFAFLLISTTSLAGPIVNTPFFSFPLKKDHILTAGYQLDQNEILVCKESDKPTTSTTIEWTYENQVHRKKLPVILKYDATQRGELVDKNGMIHLLTTHNHINVTCEYFTLESE